MWKQFWKTAPLAGVLIIMMVGAIAADYGLKLGYVFPQESAQESDLIPDASIKPQPENSSQGQASESQESSKESSMNEESSGMSSDETSQTEESSEETSSSQESSSTEESSDSHEESSSEESSGSHEESSSTEESSGESSDGSSDESSSEESEESSGNNSSSEGSSEEGSESEESSQTSKPSQEDEDGIISAYSPYAYVERDPAPPLSGYYDDPGRRALDTPCDYFTCDDRYFEDALFIGDSRIEGLALYGAMPTTSFLYN